MANFLATIVGIQTLPYVNVRSGPAVTHSLLFQSPLNIKAEVREVRPDSAGSKFNGKVFCWFHLVFSDGRSGWVRDDLIDCEGDGAAFGYGFIPQRQQAFRLVRMEFAPVVDEPIVDEPVVDEPVINEPIVDEPMIDEPIIDDPVNDEPASSAAFSLTMARDGVNVRRGPGTAHEAIARFPYRTRCEIIDARPEDNRASRFNWVQVRGNGATGWVREDYLRYDGDVSRFKLCQMDAYPAPMEDSFWVRDWNTDPTFAGIHYGWDLGARVGEPVLAGPQGGLVTQVSRCTYCTPDRPSVRQHGLNIDDPGVLRDPAWGFGYGNYVVVRYMWDALPESTQQELIRRNLPNYHLFTIYAHLHTIDVQQGQVAGPGQQIGTCGNTGNSEAAHLHLEVRAWNNPNETSTGRMISNRIDPVVLFKR